jgi:hypothetical protein
MVFSFLSAARTFPSELKPLEEVMFLFDWTKPILAEIHEMQELDHKSRIRKSLLGNDLR